VRVKNIRYQIQIPKRSFLGEQRHREEGQEHVGNGFLHVPVHEGRGRLEDNSRPLHSSRVLRRRGQQTVQSY
jgi:hypothetical protein